VRKKLRVIIAPSAELDVRSIKDFIARDKPLAARKWKGEIRKRMRSLGLMPLAHERIPEGDELALPFRHMIAGNYRVIYDVRTDHVYVLRVVHAARSLTRQFFEQQRKE
jgi:toxin ParE1/3/4